jgi:hypothetical protein
MLLLLILLLLLFSLRRLKWRFKWKAWLEGGKERGALPAGDNLAADDAVTVDAAATAAVVLLW